MGMAQRDLDLLAKYENDLVTTLSLAYLIPNLRKRKLLANNEAELLSKKDITGREANNTFLSILKTKGRDALSLFITALREEPEHLGHQTLCEELSRDYGFPPPVSSSIQAEIQASSGNDAVQLQSVVICQESGARDTRPATLVIHHQNSSSALDSGIAGNSTLSQKSSTGSEISSLITTSSNNSQSMERQLISMEGRIMNEVTEMRKDFRDVFLSDIGTTTLRQTKFVQISENKSCSSSKSRRSSMKQQGSARPSTAIPFKKSSTYPSIASVMRNVSYIISVMYCMNHVILCNKVGEKLYLFYVSKLYLQLLDKPSTCNKTRLIYICIEKCTTNINNDSIEMYVLFTYV